MHNLLYSTRYPMQDTAFNKVETTLQRGFHKRELFSTDLSKGYDEPWKIAVAIMRYCTMKVNPLEFV